MKNKFSILFIVLLIKLNAQVEINGYCDFPITTISAFEIEDHITKTERKLAEVHVDEKGKFILVFPTNAIKKIILRIDNNYSWMYVQPKGIYYIDIAKDGQITQFKSNNEIEMLFFRLDSTDINYKILSFEAWMDEYLSDIFVLKDNKPGEFIEKIIAFKREVSDSYLSDTSTFFRNYIKYSIGINVDNLNFISAPNQADKYLFYINETDILYDHDKYMEYFDYFYENYYFKLDQEIRKKMNSYILNYDFENTLNTLMIDPFVKNRACAELILLMMINKNSNDFETIKNLLSYIFENSKNDNNRVIAKNIIQKSEAIIVGALFPLIELTNNFTIKMLKGKPIYIHCFDPANQKCVAEISALTKLYEKYGKYITLISIFEKKEIPYSSSQIQSVNSIKWDKYELDPNGTTWKTLNIPSFPYYFLLDKDLILDSAPALSPSPNAEYKTIERTFFEIKREANERGE